MNFFDKAIAAISPRAAAERLYWRSVVDQVRAYDAAKVGRRTDNWLATGASQNTEARSGLDRVRYRARELERNNGIAANAIRKLAAHMVGMGIRVRPNTGDDAGVPLSAGALQQMRKNWKTFMRTCDVAMDTNYDVLMHLSARAIVRDGEVLHVWHDGPSADAPLELHVLEVDHLDTGKTLVSGEAIVIQGVQYNAMTGRREGFWLFDDHPGDTTLRVSSYWQSRFVPASRVDHIFDPLRPGQARGIPWFAPVALKSRDLSEYEEAELIRKKIEACFSAFVYKNDDAGGGMAGTSSETEAPDANGKSRRIEKLAPGMIHHLRYGEQITFGEPRPHGGVADYLKSQLYVITAGIGVPYSMGTGDVSDASYSSQREAKLDFHMMLDHWQYDMLIPMAYERAYYRVHNSFARLGLGPREFPEPVCHIPRRPWVDPEKDGEAELMELRAGGLTWEEYCSIRGLDPEEQMAVILKWKDRVEAAGLDFSKTGTGADAGDAGEDGDGDGETNDQSRRRKPKRGGIGSGDNGNGETADSD